MPTKEGVYINGYAINSLLTGFIAYPDKKILEKFEPNQCVHTNLYKSYLLDPVTRSYHSVGLDLIAFADTSLYPIS